MAEPIILLGDNTEVDEDSNGNTIISNTAGTGQIRIDPNNAEIEVTDLLSLVDASADPTDNGEIRRNGSDIKVYSGGEVKNLSNIGQASTQIETLALQSASDLPDPSNVTEPTIARLEDEDDYVAVFNE